jgi:hypothetical protein
MKDISGGVVQTSKEVVEASVHVEGEKFGPLAEVWEWFQEGKVVFNLHSYVVELVEGELPSTDGGTQHLHASCGAWVDESHETLGSLEGFLKAVGLYRVWKVDVGFRWVQFQICFL